MAATYDVTGQRKTTDIEDGNIVPVVEIDFVTKPHGIKGTIVVHDADYTLENVAAALEFAAAKDEAIASL